MKVATDYFDIAMWVSAISAALMTLAMILYPLSKKEHAKIVEQLKSLSAEQHNDSPDGEPVAEAAEGGEVVCDSAEASEPAPENDGANE